MKPLQTTYSDAFNQFVRPSQRAAGYLDRWHRDPRKALVVPFVERSTTAVMYEQSTGAIEEACGRTEHALGKVKRRVAESVREVVDWHPNFAFHHVMHGALESVGHVLTYQELRDFCGGEAGRMMLADPARGVLRQALRAGHPESAARAAIRWRVGNAYLSFMRELYVLAVLREAGIDARYHLLADVLFHVDFWIDDLCLSVYKDNPAYMSASTGRKTPASAVLGDAPFRFARLQLPTRREFGTVHLPDRREILDALP